MLKLLAPILLLTPAFAQYDLLLKGAGEEGRDISGTAEFLLDSSGTVRWRRLFHLF